MRTSGLHPAVAEHIARVRKSGFTLAPEAATDRLRRVISKGASEADLLASVRSVVGAGFTQLKLYFMIGLPTETTQDVLAIAELAQRAQAEARTISKRVQLTVSVSTFVPKPHTPFQWEAAPPLAEVRRKQGLLQARLPRRSGISLKWHDPEQSLVEAYLARADRRMAAVLERLVTPDYVGLDAWSEHFSLARWERALGEARDRREIPDPALWLGSRATAAGLPWDGIDVGVERRYLLAEARAARAEAERRDCTDGDCDQCGVCPEQPLHRLAPDSVFPHPPVPPELPPAPAPAPQPAAAASTLRIWFAKRGRARFISHLEMVGAFERAARRARLPLAFSSGFHPKPRLRFTPALPLGAESYCEIAELALRAPVVPGLVEGQLRDQLPPGLELERCEEVSAADSALLASIAGVEWRFELARPQGERLAALAARLAAGGLAVRRPGRGRAQRVRELDAATVIEELRPDADGLGFAARCALTPQGTLRPSEILRELLGLDEEEAAAARVTRSGWRFAVAAGVPAFPPALDGAE
jgi:radical SAM-linked protein